MRAAPAVGVTVQRSAHWCAALGLLCAGVTASTAVWAAQRGDALGVLALLAVLGSALGLLWRALRRPAWRLRWDGRGWWLGVPGGTEQPGELRLAIDLGLWVLLQFRAAQGGRRLWLPLQRRGLEADWHALRCALYSPRPAADRSAATDPSA